MRRSWASFVRTRGSPAGRSRRASGESVFGFLRQALAVLAAALQRPPRGVQQAEALLALGVLGDERRQPAEPQRKMGKALRMRRGGVLRVEGGAARQAGDPLGNDGGDALEHRCVQGRDSPGVYSGLASRAYSTEPCARGLPLVPCLEGYAAALAAGRRAHLGLGAEIEAVVLLRLRGLAHALLGERFARERGAVSAFHEAGSPDDTGERKGAMVPEARAARNADCFRTGVRLTGGIMRKLALPLTVAVAAG